MDNDNLTQGAPLPAPHQLNWRDWQQARPRVPSPDPRFVLRLSTPEDFPEIYDLVNSTFGINKSVAEYDWIYKNNPYGAAHCHLVVEKTSERIISTEARFPWPLASGNRDMEATQGGDSATLSQFQGQGLASLRNQLRQAHPWYNQAISFGLPNQASRNVQKKYKQSTVACAVPFAKKILDWRSLLVSKGVPDRLAKLAAPAASIFTRSPRKNQQNLSIKPIHHFSQEHQTLSLKHSRSDNFWCPHGAQWMNWRYFSHPSKKYLAYGVYDEDELQAFSVIRLDRDNAMLMELISPDTQVSQLLIQQVEHIAIEAGCKAIEVYASECWRQWPALKQQRYFMRPSNIYLSTRGIDYPEALLPENWQLLPGDSDVF